MSDGYCWSRTGQVEPKHKVDVTDEHLNSYFMPICPVIDELIYIKNKMLHVLLLSEDHIDIKLSEHCTGKRATLSTAEIINNTKRVTLAARPDVIL